MADPLSQIIIAGMAGGAGGKFVERAWDSGQKWLRTYFADHEAEAVQKAAANTNDFLARLSSKVDRLEQDQGFNTEIINGALKDPSFSVLLRKGMIASAQTSSPEKHDVIAALISERLKEQSESIVALTSPLACEAISALTVNQLKILGLITAFTYYRPTFPEKAIGNKEMFLRSCDLWFKNKISAINDVKAAEIDIDHLEALSCIQKSGLTHYNLPALLNQWAHGEFGLTEEEFWNFDSAKPLKPIWDSSLKSSLTTTIGRLIGVYVLQMTSGTKPILDAWK